MQKKKSWLMKKIQRHENNYKTIKVTWLVI